MGQDGIENKEMLHRNKGGLLWWLSSTEFACNAGEAGSIPGFGRISWRRKWQPTPVFLPGKSHGQGNLVGSSPWGRKESDTTEHHQHRRKKYHFLKLFQLWYLCFSCDAPGCTNLYISSNVKSISYSGLQSKSVKENCCEWHILYGKDSSPLPPPQPSPAVLREHPVSNIPSE